MAWQRVRAANLLASSGEEWAQVVAMYSSGGCRAAPVSSSVSAVLRPPCFPMSPLL
jgi:hypothetical protein